MSLLDKTGPQGKGPLTGGKQGYCAGFENPEERFSGEASEKGRGRRHRRHRRRHTDGSASERVA